MASSTLLSLAKAITTYLSNPKNFGKFYFLGVLKKVYILPISWSFEIFMSDTGA